MTKKKKKGGFGKLMKSSSDDVDLLNTLSGYVAMAVENARLYNSLAAKAEQYERLKEFSENIVESINVGILAADLEDRVESWNSRIERLTGIPVEDAASATEREALTATLKQDRMLMPKTPGRPDKHTRRKLRARRRD